jgi:CPA2 family monovalent cation:H+ antiporter-2
MLIDPLVLLAQWQIVAGLTVILVAGKMLITGGAFLAAGVDHRTATLAAIVMAQIGEFSFVLAGSGFEHNLLSLDQYGTILSLSLTSILAMSVILRVSGVFVRIAEHLPGVASQERLAAGPPPAIAPAGDHVVLCGYGRVGFEIGQALERWQQPYSVIELNPAIVRDLRDRGIDALYGDAASREELEAAGIATARTVAVTTPDLLTTEAVIRLSRELNPAVHVIVRAPATLDVSRLTAEGADEVVQPEFEAGLEFVRQILGWQGIAAWQSESLIASRRDMFYGSKNSHPGPGAVPAPNFRQRAAG